MAMLCFGMSGSLKSSGGSMLMERRRKMIIKKILKQYDM